MILHTPETLRPGNALIAATDDEGNILWSWHIWVPRTAITTDSYGDIWGSPAMSRDLGALIDVVKGEEASSEAYGLSYQWGNKNPYPAPSAFKASSPAKEGLHLKRLSLILPFWATRTTVTGFPFQTIHFGPTRRRQSMTLVLLDTVFPSATAASRS